MSRFDGTFPLYLEKVLDALRVVAAALTADALHLLHLPGLARRLDVLEVDLGVLAEVHDGTQEVEETCSTFTTPHTRATRAQRRRKVPNRKFPEFSRLLRSRRLTCPEVIATKVNVIN